MKVAAITGEEQAGVVDVPDPKIAENYALVKVHSVPMCTEYKAFEKGSVGQNFGHEAAGEVVEIVQPGKVKVGDRVAVMPQSPCGTCWLCLKGEYIHCQNNRRTREVCGTETGTSTYAQYVIKQDWQLVPIPDGVSYDHGGMACCGLGPTFGAMQYMNVDSFDTVLITGLGPVGLGAVINAAYRGARIIAVESHPFRAELAKKLGAETVIDPTGPGALQQIMDLTGGIGVDKCVDCSGNAEAQRLLIDASRRHGIVSFVGEAGELVIKVSGDMIRKGLNLHGAWHWNLADSHLMMKMIVESKEKLDMAITHTFPMAEVQKAWELQLTGNCGKIMLHPWE